MTSFNPLFLCFTVVLALAVDVSYERQAASMCPKGCRCGMMRPLNPSSPASDTEKNAAAAAASRASAEQLTVNCSGRNLTSIPYGIEDSRAGKDDTMSQRRIFIAACVHISHVSTY